MQATNSASGAQYNCKAGAWNLIGGGGGGGGTVTSVGFTGGLISVATPTTTPAFTVAGTSGGIPFFDSTSTWNTSALLTSNSPVLGGGAGATPKTATFLTTNGTSELDIGVIAGGNGVLGLKGNTSGTATFTAPAVAGTASNPVVSSNYLSFPDGLSNSPSVTFTAHTDRGLYDDVTVASGGMGFLTNGEWAVVSPAGFGIHPTVSYGWGSSNANSTPDTNLSRAAAGVVDVGNGTAGNTTGKLKAAGYMSLGTKFTTDTGCGTVTSLTGGATAGSFVANTTGACTVVITMGDTATAPNGWICSPSDRTTGNLFRQSASSTTTCTVTGTAVSGDVISFAAIGY